MSDNEPPITPMSVLHDNVTAMQAAWIEWKHGKGAEAAMEWIHNTLWVPGLLPEDDAPYARDAQKWFDANRSDPFPRCWCGEPAHIYSSDGGGACSRDHALRPGGAS